MINLSKKNYSLKFDFRCDIVSGLNEKRKLFNKQRNYLTIIIFFFIDKYR